MELGEVCGAFELSDLSGLLELWLGLALDAGLREKLGFFKVKEVILLCDDRVGACGGVDTGGGGGRSEEEGGGGSGSVGLQFSTVVFASVGPTGAFSRGCSRLA